MAEPVLKQGSSGPDVRDLQQAQPEIRILFPVTLAPIEPRCALDAHRRRELPPGDRMHAGLRPPGKRGGRGHQQGHGEGAHESGQTFRHGHRGYPGASR